EGRNVRATEQARHVCATRDPRAGEDVGESRRATWPVEAGVVVGRSHRARDQRRVRLQLRDAVDARRLKAGGNAVPHGYVALEHGAARVWRDGRADQVVFMTARGGEHQADTGGEQPTAVRHRRAPLERVEI